MDNTKIIFFDIDGTLIDMEKKCVTEKMLETLRRLQEKGIIICIATGRSPMDVPNSRAWNLMPLLILTAHIVIVETSRYIVIP